MYLPHSIRNWFSRSHTQKVVSYMRDSTVSVTVPEHTDLQQFSFDLVVFVPIR